MSSKRSRDKDSRNISGEASQFFNNRDVDTENSSLQQTTEKVYIHLEYFCRISKPIFPCLNLDCQKRFI